MKLINGEIIDQIVDPMELTEEVAKAFKAYADGRFSMPERFGFEENGITQLYMPCRTEACIGTKMLSLVPENRKRGLPSIDGLVILNDPETGLCRALLDGKKVTAWRTGATGALAAKLLTGTEQKRLGIVGCGVQGFHQAACIANVRNINQISLYDPFKTEREMEQFAARLRQRCPEPVIEICGSAEQLVRNSDIVVTTTFATDPVLPEDQELLRGKCYIAVGSYKPYMRELPDRLFAVADAVYVDLEYACEESGDLCTRLEKGLLKRKDVLLLQDLMGSPDIPKSETVVFKTVGMALVDIFAGQYFCRKCEEKGLGIEIAF